MTRRPLNVCGKCRYTWYPRGKDLSAQCPQCGSRDVVTAIEQALRAIGVFLEGRYMPFHTCS